MIFLLEKYLVGSQRWSVLGFIESENIEVAKEKLGLKKDPKVDCLRKEDGNLNMFRLREVKKISSAESFV